MLKVIRVFVLLLTLAGAARAGEIIIPPSPQTVKTNAVQEEPPANNEDSAEETVILTEIVLAVLVSLLP